MAEAQERADFEAHILRGLREKLPELTDFDYFTDRQSGGRYVMGWVQSQWEGWSARATPAVLGMDKVEAQRDELRAALAALTAEADHFKFVVLKPQIYSDRCTKHRAHRYLAAVEAAGKVLHAHGVAMPPLTDEQVKERAAKAGLRWIDPIPDEDGSEGYPGGFDMSSLDEIRALIGGATVPGKDQP